LCLHRVSLALTPIWHFGLAHAADFDALPSVVCAGLNKMALMPAIGRDGVDAGAAFHFGTGFALGIIIGLVSSILGVAGGELLIPTMMFIFGADIKTAGTASIVISVCVVTSGLWRYWRSDAMEVRLGARRIVSAMSVGSLIGAALGGIAVGFAPVAAIKAVLGFVLIAAAAKVAVSKH
jgi:uncharacterized membrane protein YfcA